MEVEPFLDKISSFIYLQPKFLPFFNKKDFCTVALYRPVYSLTYSPFRRKNLTFVSFYGITVGIK